MSIPFLFANKKIISKLNILLFIFILFFIYLFKEDINHLIFNYLGTGRFQSNYDPSSGGFIRVLINIVPSIICIVYGKYLSDNSVEKRFFFTISLISIISIFFALSYPTFIDRYMIYFMIIQIYTLSRISFLFHNNVYIYLTNLVIITFYIIILHVWLSLARFSFQWIPYQYKFNLFS